MKIIFLLIFSTVLISGYAQKKDTTIYKSDKSPLGGRRVALPPTDTSNVHFSLLRIADNKGNMVMEVKADSSIIVKDSALSIKQLVDAVLIGAANDRENYEKINAYTNLLIQIDKFCDCSKNMGQKELREAILALQEVRNKYSRQK